MSITTDVCTYVCTYVQIFHICSDRCRYICNDTHDENVCIADGVRIQQMLQPDYQFYLTNIILMNMV